MMMLGVEDLEAASGWGIILSVFAIPYSITMLVFSIRLSHDHKYKIHGAEGLLKLSELRDKGVLTDSEFDTQKKKILG